MLNSALEFLPVGSFSSFTVLVLKMSGGSVRHQVCSAGRPGKMCVCFESVWSGGKDLTSSLDKDILQL